MNKEMTIAMIGRLLPEAKTLIERLTDAGHRLIWLANEGETDITYPKKMEKQTDGRFSIGECLKDGCWEADAVVVMPGTVFSKEMIERIRPVVTQKLLISMKFDKGSEEQDLSELFPFSKFAEATLENLDAHWVITNIRSDSEINRHEAGELLKPAA